MVSANEKQEVFISRLKTQQPETWARYCELIANEKKTPDEMAEYDFARRREMLRFAYENTKFYKKLYDDAGLRPDDIRTEDDWNSVPIVTKQMLREHLGDMKIDEGKSERFRRFAYKTASGGSTGFPVPFYVDKREYGFIRPIDRWRTFGWWSGRKLGVILGEEPCLGQNMISIERFNTVKEFKHKLAREAAAQHMLPTEWMTLDLYDFSEENVAALTSRANEVGAFYAFGYTGVMEDVAKLYLSGKVQRRFNLKFLSVCATPLNKLSRSIIEEGWGCPVCDSYGSNETTSVAIECPCSSHNLHVLTDMKHVDLVDADGKSVPFGEEGTVVVTDFTNKVFPFVRYSLGDRTRFIKEKCSCGLPFPLIAPVQGRESDYLETKDGGKIFGLCCTFDEHTHSALRYQYVQHAPGRVSIRVVPNKKYAGYKEDLQGLLNEIQAVAGNRIDYDLQLVDEIPHDGGKIRFIVYE